MINSAKVAYSMQSVRLAGAVHDHYVELLKDGTFNDDDSGSSSASITTSGPSSSYPPISPAMTSSGASSHISSSNPMVHSVQQNHVFALDLLLRQDDSNVRAFRAVELVRCIIRLPVQHEPLDELAGDDNEAENEVDDMIEGLGEEKEGEGDEEENECDDKSDAADADEDCIPWLYFVAVTNLLSLLI